MYVILRADDFHAQSLQRKRRGRRRKKVGGKEEIEDEAEKMTKVEEKQKVVKAE